MACLIKTLILSWPPWSGCSFRYDPRTRRLRIPNKKSGQSEGSKFFCQVLVAEREASFDASHVGHVNEYRLGHMAFLIGTLRGHKVTAGRFIADNFTASCDFKAFGHRLACFATCD